MNLFERCPDIVDICFDKQGVVVERPNLIYRRRISAHNLLRSGDVLEILLATGIRTVGGRDESNCVLDAVAGHLSKCIREQRMPVAIAPVDRQVGTIHLQFLLQRRDQFSILLIDRTHSPEQVVVACNLKHPFMRNIPPSQNIFQERNHVIHPFRPTEGDD